MCRAFHLDGEEFVENYIKGSASTGKISPDQRNDVFDLVPA